MEAVINQARLELVAGDVTDQAVDAIVNAANSRLAGGGGVDGAVHRRGGPAIMADTQQRYPEGCPTGSAVISTAGQLPAQHVIHAVGPVWAGGQSGEEALLASAYWRCLELAAENNCASIAFPSLSTGAYRYPLAQAAEVALTTVVRFLQSHSRPTLVRFVLWDDAAMQAFTQALRQLVPAP